MEADAVGKSYLSRIWFGFIIPEDGFPIPQEVIDGAEINEWLDSLEDEHCGIGHQHHYEEDAMFVYVKETIQKCDELDQWALKINLPSYDSQSLQWWRYYVQRYCKKQKIKYQEPSWHLTVEHW
jgi:hypothetical protein